MSETTQGQIYSLMCKVMGDVSSIEKTRRNTQGSGYNFRGIDDVYNAMHPLFSKHGIFMVPSVLDRVREERKSSTGGNLIYTMLTVKYTFFAPDGSFVESVCVGEGFDSGDKSSNKAMSAAQKYAILQTFCIPTEDDKDSENDTPDIAPREQESAKTTRPKPLPASGGPTPPVQPNAQKSAPQQRKPQQSSSHSAEATDAQINAIFAICANELGLEGDLAKDMIYREAGVSSIDELTKGAASTLIKRLQTMAKGG